MRKLTIAEVRERCYKLDGLADGDELPELEEPATDAIAELQGVVEELNAVLAALENGNGANGKRQ